MDHCWAKNERTKACSFAEREREGMNSIFREGTLCVDAVTGRTRDLAATMGNLWVQETRRKTFRSRFKRFITVWMERRT